MNTLRITLKQVKEAAKKKGISFCRSTWKNTANGNSCAMGAIYRKNVPEYRQSTEGFWTWAKRKYGGDYVHGFYYGFDGMHENQMSHHNKRSKQGYIDGKSIGISIFGG